MLNKTIAKFCAVVIGLALAMSCSHASSRDGRAFNAAEISQDYEKPAVVGTIESNEITESSGLASSLCQPGVLWTHNDAGDNAYIFAIDAKGKHLGAWRVANAQNNDWEDMATFKDGAGTCYLYVGDIGNNKRERVEHRVYRVKEPAITAEAAASNKKNPLHTEPADAVTFRYPDTPHDAETMLAHPQTGDIYVLTKRVDGPSLVFKIAPQFGSQVRAQKVGEVAVPSVPNGLLTGGAVSPDGKYVILCDYTAGFELSVGRAGSFDEVWKQKPVQVDLGDRKQGEAVTFSADGKAIYTTSEKRNSPITIVKRK